LTVQSELELLESTLQTTKQMYNDMLILFGFGFGFGFGFASTATLESKTVLQPKPQMFFGILRQFLDSLLKVKEESILKIEISRRKTSSTNRSTLYVCACLFVCLFVCWVFVWMFIIF
jgi:hypothetical protein